MGFLKDMMRMLMGSHHGSYAGKSGGHHGGFKHGGSGYPFDYPRGPGPGNPCPKCGSANSPEARFCQQCATVLVGSRCSGCGADLSVGAKFCSQCGQAQ